MWVCKPCGFINYNDDAEKCEGCGEYGEDYWRLHNTARIEIIIDCGNCSMNKSEEEWYAKKIEELIRSRASVPLKISIFS